jgi:hypothetical protein
MTDGESYIVKRREHFDFDHIILPENKDALAEFLDDTAVAFSEGITGALAAGPKAWMMVAGRIVQAALKVQLFQQNVPRN